MQGGPGGGLPRAPDDRERVLYIDGGSRWLCAWQFVSWTCLSLSLLLFSLRSPWLYPFLVWVAAGVVYFSLSLLANTTFRCFDLAAHDAAAARLRSSSDAPSVDIFLPSCGEPLELLRHTFAHVAALEYPGHIEVLCLDDSGRDDVRRLADEFGFRYLSRPNKGEFKKAGNLRHGYLDSGGELIVVFDADFVPRADLLTELVPYALVDPTIGIVQSPQYFGLDRKRSWLQTGAGEVQELFYRWVMPGRDSRKSPICVGTNAVYRRSALEVTDGGALVENSEDVHTGFDLMAKGYRTKYVPVVLATGLCPDTVGGFYRQQHRWCSGSMSLLFSEKFWHEPIGLRPRLTFLTGMVYYLYTGFAVLIVPLPAVVMVCAFPQYVRWWNYALLVPALVQSYVLLPRWHRATYGFDVMRTKLIYAWTHLFAFSDKVFGRTLSWRPTGDATTVRKDRRVTLLLTMLVAWPVVTCAAVLVGAAVNMDGIFDVAFWPPIALAVVYAVAAACVLRPVERAVSVTPGRAIVRVADPSVLGSRLSAVLSTDHSTHG